MYIQCPSLSGESFPTISVKMRTLTFGDRTISYDTGLDMLENTGECGQVNEELKSKDFVFFFRPTHEFTCGQVTPWREKSERTLL